MSGNRKMACGTSMFFSIFGQVIAAREPPGLKDGIEKMPITEELSLEHAILDRILLAVENALKNADLKTDLTPVHQATGMIKDVVENHHMKFGEESIYPHFRRGDLGDMVEAFVSQHSEARKINNRIHNLTSTGNVRDRSEMDELLRLFNRYRTAITAHAAWEETMLFPAMLGTMSRDDMDVLKELNEQQERNLLGKDAEKKIYRQLTGLEQACGITGIRDFVGEQK
jgi:hemerythrin-like domain-containing protein